MRFAAIACNEAGLPKRCTFHGLRKAAAIRLADRGATTTQLKTVFGWKTDREAERYTKMADRVRAAKAAAELNSRTDIGSPSDPVSQKQEKG